MIPYTEPSWKNYIVKTLKPVFTLEECNKIIEIGRSQPKEDSKIFNKKQKITQEYDLRKSNVSWINFSNPDANFLFNKIETMLHQINQNNFGFENITLTEAAQYTEYGPGDHYDWHMDCSVNMLTQPKVRKISMSLLLSPSNEYEGGDLSFIRQSKKLKLEQGYATFFASFIMHKVSPVTRGLRKSLVMWFGGTPLK